jgi:protein SCO1
MPVSAGPISPAREKTVQIAVWGGLAAVLLVVVAAGAWRLMRDVGAAGTARTGPQAGYLEGTGDLGAVPDFKLTERSGRTVTREDLAGHFWIADFIFTRCTGVCPVLGARMASLAKSLRSVPQAEELRFVSFSVDPEWDTPEVLSRYATGLGNVDSRWLFLTGPHDELYRLIGEGFHLSVAQAPPDAAAGELITHSNRFVLVDPAGRIRAYYHGDDEESMTRLVRDLEKLRREAGR